jgi:hypothetical protein
LVDRQSTISYNTHTETKEHDMEDIEYAKWVLEDTATEMLKAVGIYAVALGAYWVLVG